MKLIKELAKTILRLDAQSSVTPLKNLLHVGSAFHGYHIPQHFLDANSICYCVGAGTDISLDIEIVTRFGSQVFIFDPMPYAFDHFTELINKTKASEYLTIKEGEDEYTYKISSAELTKARFIKTGMWNEKKLVKFYVPARENYAGHSITNLQNTDEFIEAPVNTLANIMQELNHKQIDLLKIEIEGSEYTVIDNVIKDKVDIKMILVEFDEFHHRKGKNVSTLKRIRASTDQICNAGYKLVHSSDHYKRTFIRNDVFALLENAV